MLKWVSSVVETNDEWSCSKSSSALLSVSDSDNTSDVDNTNFRLKMNAVKAEKILKETCRVLIFLKFGLKFVFFLFIAVCLCFLSWLIIIFIICLCAFYISIHFIIYRAYESFFWKFYITKFKFCFFFLIAHLMYKLTYCDSLWLVIDSKLWDHYLFNKAQIYRN